MNGAQCDGPRCARFGEHPNPGWLFLAVNQPDPMSILAAVLPGHHPAPVLAGTFCTYTCVADYATVAAAALEAATGTEPKPTGTGWPGISEGERP